MEQTPGTRSADLDFGYFDINTISEKDLAKIPGIGPEKARALVQHRPFTSMEEVRKLEGFTEENLDGLVRAGAVAGRPTPVRDT